MHILFAQGGRFSHIILAFQLPLFFFYSRWLQLKSLCCGIEEAFSVFYTFLSLGLEPGLFDRIEEKGHDWITRNKARLGNWKGFRPLQATSKLVTVYLCAI